MLPTRLFAFLIVTVSLCAASATAQNSPAKDGSEDSNLIHFDGAASMNISENSLEDQQRANAPQIGTDSLLDTSGPHYTSDKLPLAEGACLAIRSYRVVRDDPGSDAVHRDGYTTCVPAARFRMYSTVERQR
jgi:hypothetical protein